MRFGYRLVLAALLAVAALLIVRGAKLTFEDGITRSIVSEALAQVGCVPNPNDNGPPFNNGCSITAKGLNLLANAVGIGLPQVATNAALGNLSTAQFQTVGRLGFGAAGDSPLTVYTLQNSACSLNAGAGDGGSQVNALGGGKCWIASFGGNGIDTRVWGAKCGATDSTAALQAASNYGTANIGARLLVTCPITLAGQVTLSNSVHLTGVGPIFYPGMLVQTLASAPGFVAPTWPPTSTPTINCTSTSVACLLVAGSGVEIDHLNLGNPQPTPPASGTYSPTLYPFVISTSVAANWAGLHLHHLTFTSVSQCIDLEGQSNYNTQGIAGAQWTIEDIWFNPCLNDGIKLHQIDNTGRISNLDYDFWWYRNNPTVGAYVKTNSIGMDLQYAANTEINNVEFFANKTAILFTNATVNPGPKTFAAFNIQFTNIGFNLPCQAIGIGSGNSTLVNGGMTNVIGAMDNTGQCGAQNAFFDLSSDAVNFTLGPYVRIGQVNTFAAIGGSNSASSGVLYMDGLDVAQYSAFTASQPFLKAEAHAFYSYGTTNKLSIRGATGAGPLEGPGVSGSGPNAEQSFCVGGKPALNGAAFEGAACLQGSQGASNTGSLTLYDLSNTQQGFVGTGTASGINVTSNNGSVLLHSKNGAGSAAATFGSDTSSHNLVNLSPLPTSPPSGTGSLFVCVDSAGNLYVKSTCP